MVDVEPCKQRGRDMKHKHADMIKAKAENIELVQLMKINKVWEVVGSKSGETINFSSDYEYFLCLSKHKEACLHWLNGGDVEFKRGDVWFGYICSAWASNVRWMSEQAEIRIKPKKEKRWIAVHDNLDFCMDKPFKSKDDAEEFITGFHPNDKVSDYQFIEIEVEA